MALFRRCRAGPGNGGQLSHLAHESGLAVGGLIAVDDAACRRLVQPLHGQLQIFGRGCLAGSSSVNSRLDPGLHLGPGGLVAKAALLVRTDTLYLALDICHRVTTGYQFVGLSGRRPARRGGGPGLKGPRRWAAP